VRELKYFRHFKLCDKRQQTWRSVFERNVKFCPIFLQIFTQDTHEFQDRQSKLSNLSKILSEMIKLVFYQFIQLSFDHIIYWSNLLKKRYTVCVIIYLCLIWQTDVKDRAPRSLKILESP
jgi:hypothetical protein